MRLPRPQISLKQLLFIVAIVAINCVAYRYEYENEGRLGSNSVLSDLPEGFIPGVIPLLNVALIGSSVYLTRRLCFPWRAREADPRSKPGGITYFSLHFLALGCLVAVLMPETIAIGHVLEPVEPYVSRGWLETIDECVDAIPDPLIVPIIAGLWYSAPPLLLSSVGGLLAKRCATTMTSRRFRVMTSLVTLGFAIVALAVWVAPRSFARDQNVDLDFQIVDHDSARPIAGAFLRITNALDSDSAPSGVFTDRDGRARLTARFPASGEQSAFLIFGEFSPWGWWLEVSAPKYRTARLPLAQVVGSHVDLGGIHLQTVALRTGSTPANSFGDIAGRYQRSHAFNGSGFCIQPDGRFAWTVSGHHFSDTEYGFLKRSRESIELVTIPKPGEEIHPRKIRKFRIVAWGERLYVCLDY
jgi:hypothetical protein